MNKRMWPTGIIVTLVLLALIATGCDPGSTAKQKPSHRTLTVYAFSTEEEVMIQDIFPAFQVHWEHLTGGEMTFRGMFTGSEEIANAILDGAPAEVAILSNEYHSTWLHIANQVQTDWHDFPNAGIVSRSPLVIVVRPGNPLAITDWVDLARPGVKLIHADPRTSGVAQWGLLAEYGSALLTLGNSEAASTQLEAIWANVISTPSSARDAMKEFLFGAGDALVTYEQDALLAKSRGADIEIVTPPATIVSEHVVVIVDRNVNDREQEIVRTFVNFLWSERAQQALTHYYFRAVTDEALNQGVPEFHQVERPFTVDDLGGWSKAYHEIINGIWQEQIAPR